jgi:hypothetical protein
MSRGVAYDKLGARRLRAGIASRLDTLGHLGLGLSRRLGEACSDRTLHLGIEGDVPLF